MSDALQIGVSGLLAFQRALGTTSHNISNVNTPGYSRQNTVLDVLNPTPAANGFIGNGVQVSSIQRMYNQFLVGQVRTNTTLNSQYQNYYQYASQVDNLLSDPKAGLSPALQDFFSAVQGVSNDPSSIPARQVLLTQAGSLVNRFQYLHTNLNNLFTGVNSQITSDVSEINSLAASIAKLNGDIVTAQGAAGGQPANDLLDQRDELLRQLSEKVSVSAVPQDDGAMNVFIGNGQTLVIGNNASTLSAQIDGADPTKLSVQLTAANATPVDVTSAMQGGEVGGLLDFTKNMLAPALNSLGRVAINIATAFNTQHAAGLDLNNALGGQFFTVPTPAVLSDSGNTTTNAPTVTITDPGQLTNADYQLSFNTVSATWSLINTSSKQVVASGTGATPLTADGLSVDVSAIGAVAGNQYHFDVRPTRDAAQNIGVAITDPSQIAAAGAVRTTSDSANLGSATIAPGMVIDPTSPSFLATATIQFGSSAPGTMVANQYSLDGGVTWNAYTSGANIDVNGMRTQITGTAYVGDTFVIGKNTGGVSDNRNALALGALQTTPTMLKNTVGTPTADFQSAYGQLVSEVGTKTHQVDINRTAQQAVLDQSVQAREGVSGVNLDEEAANMVKYQQAYQATAQVISTAASLFQTLLAAVKG